MEGYSMYFPCYTIGHGVYEKVGKVCCDYGTSAVIIGGHKALAAAQDKLLQACREGGITVTGILWYGGECAYENVDRLAAEQAVQKLSLPSRPSLRTARDARA